MSELVADEMVEVAARTEADVSWPTTAWDDLPYDVRAVLVDHAHAALEAAAPQIAAQDSGTRRMQQMMRTPKKTCRAGRTATATWTGLVRRWTKSGPALHGSRGARE